MSELKPCPCGGKPRMARWHDEDGLLWVRAECTCGIHTRGNWCRPGNDCPIFYEEIRSEWNELKKPLSV